jgi:ABC-type transport system involved in cytochrome c biogenesis permease component
MLRTALNHWGTLSAFSLRAILFNRAVTLLPVIGRELRASSRHAATYHLRVLAAVAALVVLAMFGLRGGITLDAGPELFASLHQTIFFTVWVLVPVLAADCLSHERREGTLPLLFLTALRPRDIVSAKGFAHLLRAFTLWAAVLPVLTICFLLGGVGWSDVAFSILVNFASICLATSAAVLASSLGRAWSRALVGSFSIAFALILLFSAGLHASVQFFSGGWPASVFTTTPYPLRESPQFAPGRGLALALNWDDEWRNLTTAPPVNIRFGPRGMLIRGPRFRPTTGVVVSFGWLMPRYGAHELLASFACGALASLFWLLLTIRFSAWRIQRTWQENPPPPVVTKMRDTLVRPVVFQGTLRRWLGWQLRRNPIGWLEQRSWSGRLVIWSWFAVVACVYSSLLANLPLYEHGFPQWQRFLSLLLVGSMALNAAGSFRRERESGVLELLLVAPLRESQIIFGRLVGMWTQFLPAILLLCAVWLYVAAFLPGDSQLAPLVQFVVACLTVPVVGLYFSLARGSTLAAFLWTTGIQIVAPAALATGWRFCSGGYRSLMYPGSMAATLAVLLEMTIQIGFVALFGWRLYADLHTRRFVLR